MTRPAPPFRARRLFLASALVLVALNLRPSLTSIGPLLPEAMQGTGLDPAEAGLITTIPILCLGVFGLSSTWWTRRLGTERTILLFLLALAAALAVRVLGTAAALVAGCAVGGLAIGIVNVLIPGLIKREFPDQAANMTGLNATALAAGAAVAAGASVPLADALGGWARSLAFWAAPALVAAAVWSFQAAPRPAAPPAAAIGVARTGLWRDPLAWQVTGFMGLQSSLAYAIFAWLAPMLRDRGLSPVEAGLIVSGCILVNMPAALVAPWLSTRGKDQRAAVLAVMVLSIVGLAGLLFAPLEGRWLWAVILGLGQGAAFALALALVVFRSGDAATAARLSSMSQGVGYTIAACGPLFMGLLRSWTGGWTAPAILFMAIAAGATICGLGAGRARLVSGSAPAPARPAPEAA
jgi:CP family cyanate transporter-like MFS transporter